MSTQASPLQARLHMGDRTLVLPSDHDNLTSLKVQLLSTLDQLPTGTGGSIINLKNKRILFRARKAGH